MKTQFSGAKFKLNVAPPDGAYQSILEYQQDIIGLHYKATHYNQILRDPHFHSFKVGNKKRSFQDKFHLNLALKGKWTFSKLYK